MAIKKKSASGDTNTTIIITQFLLPKLFLNQALKSSPKMYI
jgi:hypothetical protein